MKNTWGAKIIRNLTAFLPISKKRIGECVRCGACCYLPKKCLFLKINKNNEPKCLIYLIRPPVCRKYPRTANQHITQETCGFKFKE